MKQTAKLENWYQIGNSLFGQVYGHPKLPDGTIVQTSEVVHIDYIAKTAETINTEYSLGNKFNFNDSIVDEEGD